MNSPLTYISFIQKTCALYHFGRHYQSWGFSMDSKKSKFNVMAASPLASAGQTKTDPLYFCLA
jgi:hypothetical protein